MNVAAAKLARSEVKVENGAGYLRTGYHQRVRIRLERLLTIRERLVASRYVPFVIGACINAAIFITLYVWLSSCSEAAVSSQPSNHTESASSWCGQDWVAHGDKCYKLLGSQAFDAAKGDCEQVNGTLASIHNTAQNRFLTKYVRGEHGEEAKFYIGLQRSVSNNFAWLDGSACDFQ
ncbi:natural killer cell receptor protein NKR-P1D, partial [Aphelenchoides avenae]